MYVYVYIYIYIYTNIKYKKRQKKIDVALQSTASFNSVPRILQCRQGTKIILKNGTGHDRLGLSIMEKV